MGASSRDNYLCKEELQWGKARKIERLECGLAHFKDNTHEWRASIQAHEKYHHTFTLMAGGDGDHLKVLEVFPHCRALQLTTERPGE